MDQNGNFKLEHFEKDRLIYTIPDSNAASIGSSKQNNMTATIDKKQA